MSNVSSESWQRQDVGSGFGEFFRYHGWLSPGIRAFRRITFPAKASWVAAAFGVPLVVLLGLLWSSTNEQVNLASSELQGLTYVRPVLALVALAQERRRAATSGEVGMKSASSGFQLQRPDIGWMQGCPFGLEPDRRMKSTAPT